MAKHSSCMCHRDIYTHNAEAWGYFSQKPRHPVTNPTLLKETLHLTSQLLKTTIQTCIKTNLPSVEIVETQKEKMRQQGHRVSLQNRSQRPSGLS